MNLSENENKEIFELTIGGFGLTGSIIEVTKARKIVVTILQN